MTSKRWVGALAFISGLAMLVHPLYGQIQDTMANQGAEEDSLTTARHHLSFGANYLKNKQYKDAETQFLKAWDYNPTYATTARYLGRLYNEMEKYDEAVNWFQKSLSTDSTSQYAKSAYLDLAGIYAIQENRQGAIECYTALLGFSPGKDEAITYLHHLVGLYVEGKDYKKALEYTKSCGKLAPDDPDVREMIGKLMQSTGDADEALKEYEKVIQMHPDDQVTREKLAGMYQANGDYEKAFDAYEILHKNDPKNYVYMEKSVDLAKRLKKPTSFIVDRLEEMHRLQPNNLAVVEQLADQTGALKWINLGLQKDPRNGKYPYMMGEYYYDIWQKSNAAQDSLEALNWFKKAQSDPQWRGNARFMIQTINPPKTKEELKQEEFFKKNKKEEVKEEGKK